MKKLLKSIVIAVASLTALSVNAHQPDYSSIILIEQETGEWTMQLNASMTAFQYEVRNAYGDDSYSSPDEFNQLLVTHLKDKIAIQMNGKPVTMGTGMVKLGHETAVVIELSDITEDLYVVFVSNLAFKNIHHSQAILSIIREGLDKSRFVLNEENDYQVRLTLEKNQVLIAETPSQSFPIMLVSGAILIGLGLVVFTFRPGRKPLRQEAIFSNS